MTALKKYQRLECPGLWRETATAQRREVIVAFREATLVLADPRTESALTHWSLPAVERLNHGESPALYAPAPDTSETLEIEDADMVAALETVRGAVMRGKPRPGRLRNWIVGGATALVLALGIFWVPGALVRHTAAMLPAATQAEIGRMALKDLTRLTGAPCSTPLGQAAALELSQKLFGADGAQVMFLRDGLTAPVSLPGGMILLPRSAVEAADGPEAAAGFALAEALRSTAEDPMIALLDHAGPVATFRLLTSGSLNPDALVGYGEVLLRRTPAAVDPEALIAAFKAAGVPSTAYAYALDKSGETTLALIEADPFGGKSPQPLMPDGAWISLQAICSQ